MAKICPFRALRPKPDLAVQICELPYDVVSTAEARAAAIERPWSFFHVSRPEIDLPDATDSYDPRVYQKGRENFMRLIDGGLLRQDSKPCYYIYRQIMGDRTQVGLVAAASCEDYRQNVIKRHELTRPEKEEDRRRHIESLNAQTGPVFLVYRARNTIDELCKTKMAEPAEVDFTAPGGVRHSAWTINDPRQIEAVQAEFDQVQSIYIADGHHRTAAAASICTARKAAARNDLRSPQESTCGAGQAGSCDPGAYFLSVLFPHDQVKILPYNRVLKDTNGLDSAQLLERLGKVFIIGVDGQAQPARRHTVSLFLDRRWFELRFRPELLAPANPVQRLDASLLQTHVLEPVFGVENPRTSQRIGFIGGIRGTSELERLVVQGNYACAFSMFPTQIEELMSVADGGGMMPPKSTWFEPKLLDGMFCHML